MYSYFAYGNLNSHSIHVQHQWQQQMDIAAIILPREHNAVTIIERNDIVWSGGKNYGNHKGAELSRTS